MATEQPPASDSIPDASLPHLNHLTNLFRSLGNDCEFGVVQRRAGADPIDLLRFAAMEVPEEHRIQALTHAISRGFAGLGDIETISCQLNIALDQGKREYSIQESNYRLRYHTFRFEGDIVPEQLCQQQMQILRFWRRKFVDDLRLAEKLCVWKSGTPHPEADVRALLAATRVYGPNCLLWINAAREGAPAGVVEDLGDGLYRGSVSRFAVYRDVPDIDHESWYDLCESAYRTIPMLQQAWRVASRELPPPEPPHYKGAVHWIIDDKLFGWCVRLGDPAPVWLELSIDGRRFSRFRADRNRKLSPQEGGGYDPHAFYAPLPLRTLAPEAVISVKIMRTPFDLPNSGRALADYPRV